MGLMTINNNGILVDKLKCIGGPNDGEWHGIGSCDRIGDTVRVRKKLKPINLNSLGSIHDTIVHWNIYIISCFHFAKDDIYYFLIPKGWTNKRAMQHHFDK